MSLSAVRGSKCPKCGTTKQSGKRSCCAPGGAWFKKCGDAGDMTFDHTWSEGIYVCKEYTESVFEYMEVVIAYPPNTSHSRNITPQQTNIYRSGSMSNADNTYSEVCIGLTKTVAFICVWCMILRFQK